MACDTMFVDEWFDLGAVIYLLTIGIFEATAAENGQNQTKSG